MLETKAGLAGDVIFGTALIGAFAAGRVDGMGIALKTVDVGLRGMGGGFKGVFWPPGGRDKARVGCNSGKESDDWEAVGSVEVGFDGAFVEAEGGMDAIS